MVRRPEIEERKIERKILEFRKNVFKWTQRYSLSKRERKAKKFVRVEHLSDERRTVASASSFTLRLEGEEALVRAGVVVSRRLE